MRQLKAPGFELEKSSQELQMRDVTVIMPLAGKGTRAREVTKDTIPKPLIKLEGERTILDTICEKLQEVGFRNFVFCVGHHKQQIIDHLSTERWIQTDDVSYRFAQEDTLSGVDGAVLNAVETFDLKGQAMIVPGDMLHDWNGLVAMNREHKRSGAGITMGTTSYITERTTDVGKLIAEDGTNRLVWAYGRTDEPETSIEGVKNLTSIGVNIINTEDFRELCGQFLTANPEEHNNIGLRDTVGPWAIRAGSIALHAYDTKAEMIDLGTPANIYYGQANWRNFE